MHTVHIDHKRDTLYHTSSSARYILSMPIGPAYCGYRGPTRLPDYSWIEIRDATVPKEVEADRSCHGSSQNMADESELHSKKTRAGPTPTPVILGFSPTRPLQVSIWLSLNGQHVHTDPHSGNLSKRQPIELHYSRSYQTLSHLHNLTLTQNRQNSISERDPFSSPFLSFYISSL